MFLLEEFSGGTRISSTTIDPGSRTRITFGRGPVDYKLAGAQASRIQATLTLNSGEWWVWDGQPEEPSTNGIFSDSDRLYGQSPIRGRIWLYRGTADTYATLTPISGDFCLDATQGADLIGEIAQGLAEMRATAAELSTEFRGAIATLTAETQALRAGHVEQRRRDTQQNRAIFGLAIAGSLVLVLLSGQGALDEKRRDQLQEMVFQLVVSGLMLGGATMGYRQNEKASKEG